MLAVDHLVVGAQTLREGVAHVREALGITIPFGGAHDLVATHNHLVQLGPDAFLEVIAPEPERASARPRWYGLDHFTGPPRLLTYVLRTDDLTGALSRLPEAVGAPVRVRRGELTFTFVGPSDGELAWDGALPSLITWDGNARPWEAMADKGATLQSLTVTSPKHAEIRAALDPLFGDPRVSFVDGSPVSLCAQIEVDGQTRALR